MKRKLSGILIALFALLVSSFCANAVVYARLERGAIVTEYHTGYNVQYYTTVEVRFYLHPSCAPVCYTGVHRPGSKG
ncbi:MAG: hypothetical protein H7Y86_20190 [Rhizobacter sp.]|nr:hypothetical protein [Ferruginibacter sp.]